MRSTLNERLAKDFPDKDLRVLSIEPVKVRYRAGGCSATTGSKGEATYETVKALAFECIKMVEG